MHICRTPKVVSLNQSPRLPLNKIHFGWYDAGINIVPSQNMLYFLALALANSVETSSMFHHSV